MIFLPTSIMNAPLILGPAEMAKIETLVKYAGDHRIDCHEIYRRLNQPEKAIGDDPNLRIYLPFGYRCVFSIEQSGEHKKTHEMMWVRHFSCSHITGVLPASELVERLVRCFGFIKDPNEWQVFIEGNRAVNVVELLDTPPT